MSKPDIRWFSRQYIWVQDKLLIPLQLVDPNTGEKSESCLGLIDTGASCCMISGRMGKKLWLVPVGRIPVMTPAWQSDHNQYVTCLLLPDNYMTDLLYVTEWPIDLQGFDVLIWMDVLSKGDFTMTKRSWNTLISFIAPSQDPIDLAHKYVLRNILSERMENERLKRLNGKNNRKKKKRK